MTVFLYKKKPKILKTALMKKTKKNIISYFNGIPPGTTVYAELTTAVFSFNTKAPVKAKLLQNIYTKKRKLVMPEGTIFLGTVSTIHSQDRVNIAFSQAVYPNGETYNINALALSNNGSAGIKGQVNSPAFVDTLEGVGEAVLGLGSLFFGGNNSNPYSMNDQLKYAAGSSLTNQAANSLANAQANNKTTITVKAGKTIRIMFLSGFNK
jgi:type IV secretory pathway VirB10-like protein